MEGKMNGLRKEGKERRQKGKKEVDKTRRKGSSEIVSQ